MREVCNLLLGCSDWDWEVDLDLKNYFGVDFEAVAEIVEDQM